MQTQRSLIRVRVTLAFLAWLAAGATLARAQELGIIAKKPTKPKLQSAQLAPMLPSLLMLTDQIISLLIAERDKLNRAIEALQGTKRRGRPPKSGIVLTASAP
jgi:hypothetical protein